MGNDMNFGNKMPYNVPEGYFEGLRAKISEIPDREPEVTMMSRVRPYFALAAAFVAIVVAGTAVLKVTSGVSQVEEMSALDKMQMADIVPVTDPYSIYCGLQEESITHDDITAYLIDSGTTLEHIEYYDAGHDNQ